VKDMEWGRDLRRVGIVLASVVPWVDYSIGHELCVGLSRGCLGHARD
jgi:hypothetical protein